MKTYTNDFGGQDNLIQQSSTESVTWGCDLSLNYTIGVFIAKSWPNKISVNHFFIKFVINSFVNIRKINIT